MSNNITWCLLRNLSLKKNSNIIKSNSVNKTIQHFQHSLNRGYEDDNNIQINKHKTDKDEHKTYRTYLDEKNIGYTTAIQTLMKTPKLSRSTAIKIVQEYQIFQALSKSTITQNYEILHENDVQQSTLKDNAYALADTTANIKKKIQCCKDIDLDVSSAIALFQLRTIDFLQFLRTHKEDEEFLGYFKNRIEYLADKLGYEISTLCPSLSRWPHVLTMSFSKLQNITDFLLESGIESKHIIADLNVYQFNYSTIQTRIERAKKAGLDPLKPWVVRCPIELIENAEERIAQRKLLLNGDESLELYISRVMACKIESVEACLKRSPKISKMSLSDLTDKLIFYRDAGYTIEDLYRVPNAFHASFHTIKTRYQMWIDLGFDKPPLFAITTSQTNFDNSLKHAKLQVK